MPRRDDTSSPGPSEADLDVLIVGAGPTGLTLGCELARRALSIRVVDRLPGPDVPFTRQGSAAEGHLHAGGLRQVRYGDRQGPAKSVSVPGALPSAGLRAACWRAA